MAAGPTQKSAATKKRFRPVRSPVAKSSSAKRNARAGITITVRRLPEGVYLATSDDLPGLTVECETREQLIDEAREVAVALMRAGGQELDAPMQRFAFVFEY
jgi:predicted RNase H-like HicB family nuclease